ncbi:PIG-L deacetylase family protein [Methyloceanibacter sp. wino2]|uniref:PIG-L deacetylase family protein n=1 Tax=Methyloceanibacter sp. wino2 TaxID=2170729 RepID=UPI00131F3C78|nr:PIG-L family deacetylase [Methyloceanibacter sp. wino2]
MTTVFVFAHQDDDFGVFHEIADAVARKERVVCIYLTNGAWAGVTPQQRNMESLTVLTSLGVNTEAIKFLGTELDIPDGSLVENLDRCWDKLLSEVETLEDVTRVIVPAWEGGHHDHDAAHLVGLALARHLNVLEESRQYPFYRAPTLGFWLSFAAPLEANGPATLRPMGWRERLDYLLLLRHYRSQGSVMLKLAPQLAWSYLTKGDQALQPLNPRRALEAPMERPLLYETWGLCTYERFRTHADPFIARHIVSGPGLDAGETAQRRSLAEPSKTN